MATIASLSVSLSANISGFVTNMSTAAGKLGGINKAFARATDSAKAWKALTSNMGELKLAGKQTTQSLQTTLAVARSELRRFMRNDDVKFVVGLASDKLNAAWEKAKANLQALVNHSRITAAVTLAAGKASGVAQWIGKLRATVGRGIRIPINLAREKFDAAYLATRLKIEGLRRFRAVRIGLALIDHFKLPAAAAMQALAPLRKLAGSGIKIALRATQIGVIKGVNAARTALSALKSFASGILSSLSGPMGLLGAAAGAAGGFGMVELVKGTMESMDATAKLSDRLGTATEKLSGLEYAASLTGIGTEEMTTGLEKMLKSLGEAASGTSMASAAFAHLGLNAAKLSESKPDEAFSTIAEKLKAIQNPAERAAVTMEIFGRSGQELLPLLMKGSEGIAAMTGEADKLHKSFTRVDAAKVEMAGESVKKLESLAQGAVQTLVIELAPYIEAVANKLTNMGTSGKGAAGVIIDAFEWIVTAVANMSDYLEAGKAEWYALKYVVIGSALGLVKSIEYIGKGLNWLLGKLGITKVGWAQMAHDMGDDLSLQMDEAFEQAGEHMDNFNRGVNAIKAKALFADIRAEADKSAKAIADNAGKLNGGAASTENWGKKLEKAAEDAKKVTDTLAELQKQIDTFGMTEAQKRVFDLKGMTGITPEQLAAAKNMADNLEMMTNAKAAGDAIKEFQRDIDQLNMTEAQKKLADLKLPGVSPEAMAKLKELAERLDAMKEGKAVFDETRTPMEKYEKQIGKLSTLLNAGMISWDTYGRAVRAAREQLEKAAKTNAPELLDSGTAAADKYLYNQKNAKAFDFTPGARQQDANKDKMEELQYQEQYNSRIILQRIENKLTDSNAVPTQTVEIA